MVRIDVAGRAEAPARTQVDRAAGGWAAGRDPELSVRLPRLEAQLCL